MNLGYNLFSDWLKGGLNAACVYPGCCQGLCSQLTFLCWSGFPHYFLCVVSLPKIFTYRLFFAIKHAMVRKVFWVVCFYPLCINFLRLYINHNFILMIYRFWLHNTIHIERLLNYKSFASTGNRTPNNFIMTLERFRGRNKSNCAKSYNSVLLLFIVRIWSEEYKLIIPQVFIIMVYLVKFPIWIFVLLYWFCCKYRTFCF